MTTEGDTAGLEERVTVTAILASHNRRQKTLACLASYFEQEIDPTVRLLAVLVDDASSDGTAAAVGERFPRVEVVAGSGSLYWAGAMAIAEQAALAGAPHFLLWLNDDVVLDPRSVSKLLAVYRDAGDRSIVVGAMRDPANAALTYSGVRRTGWHPLRMVRVQPSKGPVEVETFNGNAVLVSREVHASVGPIDGGLIHSAADHDYGLRARRAGVQNLLAPGTVGTCPRDGELRPWLRPDLPMRDRLSVLLGPKGLPPKPRARYLRRHGGRAWLLFWLWPYVRVMPSLAWLGLRRVGSS